MTPYTEHVARSCMDPALTAFAQLGALRLNAQRALISLFGPEKQHVLAEATQTLSLQDDADHNSRDHLWVGSCTLSYERSLCKAAMDSVQMVANARDRIFVVPDLTMDDSLKSHPDVMEFPNVRFLASSPIISPKGIIIGAYTILDDQPHDHLDGEMLNFLVSISMAVMDYLSATRSKEQQLRSERMLVGLGSFLEGKGSLRNSWLIEKDDYDYLLENNTLVEGHVDPTQQHIQVAHQATSVTLNTPANNRLPSRPYSIYIPEREGKRASSQEAIPRSADTTVRDRETHPNTGREPEILTSHGPKRSPLPKRSPKEEYTAKIKDTFSRASNLIRESIEVEAVVFFGASFGSKDAPLNDNRSESDTSGSLESCSSGFRESQRWDPLSPEVPDRSGKIALIPCEIFGFATSDASSINGQSTGDNQIVLNESFLAALLHRYPRGKVFNYAADGSMFSDDSSEESPKRFLRGTKLKSSQRARKSWMRQDASTLLQVSPGSRSIIFAPLWDSHKSRWYAGSLTWTRAAYRVFTHDEELSFLLTFGNSVMAEVHRLGARFTDRAKSDLLAGLSHELRSPLHGIFGTSELLGNTILDTLQRGFIHTISSCAFTLLGSINQLLEYASINDILPSSVRSPRDEINPASESSVAAARRSSHAGKVDTDSCVELDSVVEDVIETVFAGHSFVDGSQWSLRHSIDYSTLSRDPLDIKGPVKIVLDIDGYHNWRFSTRPGAWYVIITNVLGNALKFTRQGYIFVSMKAIPAEGVDEAQALSSEVTITVKDTGCGIEPEYLKKGLFTAFSQQDSTTTGNGLGLNITHRTLKSLGGDIQVSSQEHVGTEVVVTVTLDREVGDEAPDQADSQFSLVNAIKLTRTKSIGILGFESSALDTILHTCLLKVFRDWLAMNTYIMVPFEAQFTYCDFYISLHEHLDIGNLEIQEIAPATKERLPSPLIIICSSPKVAHAMFTENRRRKNPAVLEFISQPCGPRKLAKTLETCIRRQQKRLDSVSDEETPGLPVAPLVPFGLSKSMTESSEISPSSMPITEPPMSPTDYAASTSRTSGSHSPNYPDDPRSTRAIPKDEISIGAKQSEKDDGIAISENTQPRTVVLLVDDNDINMRLLIAFMKRLKCDYVIAQNGKEAVHSFKSSFSKICMVLMDISMPIMDGIEATRLIRQFERKVNLTPRVTIAGLTGLAQADVQRDAIASGMDLFLTKPVGLDGLVPIIKGAMAKYGPALP
ncbi:unnamed protein product [Penicillium olsonii]|uniref:histidine kinase n=1 Tax=Penicillium olsonii TaxID=99116 RepID=A0A9W4IAI1_PENOL|nr:unnamed protein product [Penicillium olsonii]CAG8250411.1 unnamed protein product [Penicillium olsonii]